MTKQSHKPQQYIRGYVEFYKLRFKVTPNVLIPRPETELLVDEVIAHAKRSNHPEERYSDEGSTYSKLTILDIGTGCGNIAISITKHLPTSDVGRQIIATDISSKALKVAKQNAKFHGVSEQITFLKSNLLSNFSQLSRSASLSKVDVIVANLPYIPSERIPYLDSSVKDFEPHIALDGGKDGFELYRKLFQQISSLHTGFVDSIPNPVWKPKLMVCEIDYTHGELAAYEAQKFFPESEVEIKTDLAHKQRILIIEF